LFYFSFISVLFQM